MLIRKLLLLLTLLTVVSGAYAQNVPISGTAQYNSGVSVRVLPSATITVCQASDTSIPCTTKVSLFSNSTGTPALSNPFYADANGNYQYFIPSTAIIYTETVTRAGFKGFSRQVSPGGGGGGLLIGRSILGATSSDLVTPGDNLFIIYHNQAASSNNTETIPTTTSLGIPSFAFGYSEDSAFTTTLKATTFTIQLGNAAPVAGSTGITIPSGAFARVTVDPALLTQWHVDCVLCTGGPGQSITPSSINNVIFVFIYQPPPTHLARAIAQSLSISL